MKNIIIGTAGHIDHGKTTLIKALTGRNTDRWPEEQRRGITIDLGFTWFDLPDGLKAGIIDVPGHEKFIPKMVAGVVGMDLVLLVIAADEGIMPQTKEHMDILKLLGIEKCIIVLNKCDLVEEEWLELMEEEIRETLSDTFLKDSPVVKVSAVTGQGLDELTEAITAMVNREIVPKEINTISRLPVDRVFTIQGFGTVVTGTLVSGKICKEDELEIYPSQIRCKARNIQVYEHDREEAQAGQRVAVNLAGIRKEEIHRGCILTPVNSMKNTKLLDVRLTVLQGTERTIKNRSRLHLFTGTTEVLCRAILLNSEELKPGETGYVQLRLEEETAVRRGDKFIVRFYSPMETIGGGEILEPNPRMKKRFRPDVIRELQQKESGSVADIVDIHVRNQKNQLITVTELAKMTALSTDEIQEAVDILLEERAICRYALKKEVFLWSMDQFISCSMSLVRELNEYQERFPYRHGMKKAEVLMNSFRLIKPNVFNLILEDWQSEGILKLEEEYISTPGHEIRKDECYESAKDQLLKAIREAGFHFIREEDVICKEVTDEQKHDIVNLLREDQLLVMFGEGYLAHKEVMDQAADQIREQMANAPVISISEVRDLFETSRKNAKLILEYTDSVRITRKGAAESEWKKY